MTLATPEGNEANTCTPDECPACEYFNICGDDPNVDDLPDNEELKQLLLTIHSNGQTVPAV